MSGQIGKALKLARQFHDFSQTQMADRLAISKSYLSEIEAGDKIPTLQLLEKFSFVLEIPLSSLLMFKESVETNTVRGVASRKALKMMKWLIEASDEEK